MTTILCTMLGGPSSGPSTGMATRAVAACNPGYAAAVSPVIPASAGVVAWRKATAVGTRSVHHFDDVFATPVGSGGSG